MADLSEADTARLAMRLEGACAQVLAGHPHDAQGAAIAGLLGVWLSGHLQRQIWPLLLHGVATTALRIANEHSQLPPSGGLNG